MEKALAPVLDNSHDQEKEKKKEEVVRCWSDLQPELVSLILAHLCAWDHNTFHAICRSWQSIPPIIWSLPLPIHSRILQSPYLMSLNKINSICKFYHPLYNSTYYMDIPELTDVIIRFSKDGWLLVSEGETSMFFFNPFTKVRIELPDIIGPNGKNWFNNMSFSSPPTSSGCLVVAIGSNDFGSVTIGLLKRGEENWTYKEFENSADFMMSNCHPIIHNGLCYCLGTEGNIGIFDPNDNGGSWTVGGKLLKQEVRKCQQGFMIECEGDLLAVFVSKDEDVYAFRMVITKNKNRRQLVWEDLKSTLENRMLYVCHSASLSQVAVMKETANKIYFPKLYKNTCLFYSLATRKYHTFVGNYSSDKIFGTKELKHCTWIKPVIGGARNVEAKW